jgi:RHS repeat-associated protein
MGIHKLDLVEEYTGYTYDRVLDLYYAKARMYNAVDRRFMAVDPVKGDAKTPATMVQYTYCLNNPVRYVDLDGAYYIELYRKNSQYRCRAVKEPVSLILVKMGISAIPYAPLQGVFVPLAESNTYNFVGGTSMTEVTSVAGVIRTIIRDTAQTRAIKLSGASSKMLGPASTVINVATSFLSGVGIRDIDKVAFELFKRANISLDVQTSIINYNGKFAESGVIILEGMMEKAYRFIADNTSYFFGLFPNTATTFWQVDLEFGNPKLSTSAISKKVDKYFNHMKCGVRLARDNRTIWSELGLNSKKTSLGDAYLIGIDRGKEYVNNWKTRLNSVIEEFKKRIYPKSWINAR